MILLTGQYRETVEFTFNTSPSEIFQFLKLLFFLKIFLELEKNQLFATDLSENSQKRL